MTPSRYRLDDLVLARSVAVVGASQDPTRIGGRPIAFLRQAGFTGAIYHASWSGQFPARVASAQAPTRPSRSTSSIARPCCAPPGCPRSRRGWS
jgi:hypothetical protein